MDYGKTLEFLYSQLPAYHRIGKAAYKSDLENSLALDIYLGYPHMNYRTIHIAGTNGKGSVSHMLASVLKEAGLKTGLYTSPHLKDFRERIKINGMMIPKKSVKEFVERHSAFIGSLKPSFFEMTVAMAFDYFAEAGVDIAVVETGLGGRLDSTNIINPVLSVITNTGHDHMDLLGDSLGKIAVEKAGIIKKNVPVVIGETLPETRAIFIRKAEETGSEILFADQYYSCQMFGNEGNAGGKIYHVTDRESGKSFKGEIRPGGDYQVKNLQTLFGALRVLRDSCEITDKDVKTGIARVIENTGLMGRWQIIGRKPLIICDVGHNREGLEYVIRQLQRVQKEKMHIIIGFVNDKDLNSVLPLFPLSADYYFTKASVPRALDEKILMEEARLHGLSGARYPDVKTAITAALSAASEDDLIFIGGSTFIVADALENFVHLKIKIA